MSGAAIDAALEQKPQQNQSRFTSHKDFSYESSLTDNEIRLLELLPASNWDSTIYTKIQRVNLDQEPQYEALSYVWGNPRDVVSINVNDCEFKVTRNLEIALRYLRDTKKIRILWIDAICINQDNIIEKSAQVNKMGDIYSRAEHTVMWLGAPTERIRRAFADLEILTEKLLQYEDLLISDNGEIGDVNVLIERCGFNVADYDFAAIWEFAGLPYWTRVWIAQEFLLCGREDKSGTVQCGNLQLPKDSIIVFLMFVNRCGTSVQLHKDITEQLKSAAQSPLMAMLKMWTSFIGTTGPHLGSQDAFHWLIFSSLPFQATDNRDKLFALLGLAPDPGIVADYTKSIRETYVHATWRLIQKTKKLDIMRGNREDRNQFGPSWTIPDRYSEPSYATFSTPGWQSLLKFYCASGSESMVAQLDESTDDLLCTGVQLGTVTRIIGPFESYAKEASNFSDKLAELRAFATSIQDVETREKCWRCLLMDVEFTQPVFGGDAIYPASDKLEIGYATIIEQVSPPDNISEEDHLFRCSRFDEAFGNLVLRSFFQTDTGHFGIGPYALKEDDIVAVLSGGSYPFALRSTGDHYEVIGEAYVQGVMNGQAMKKNPDNSIVGARNFVLC